MTLFPPPDSKYMKLPFSLLKEDHDLVKMGLIVLESDLTLETEIHHFLSQKKTAARRISLLHTRIPCNDNVTASNLKQMEGEFEKSLILFPKTHKFDVLGYGCTSASVLIGESKVTTLIKSVISCQWVTTPITAVKAALKHLNVKKIGYIAPYMSSLVDAMCMDLENCGIQIKVAGTFEEGKDSVVGNISSNSIENAIETLISNQSNLEAVFVACTSLKCAPIIPAAEEKYGIPIISSNSALAWHMAHLTGARVFNVGKGKLFSTGNVSV